MRLINVDNLTLSYAGLAKMSPYDFEGITKLFYDQIQAARTVEAIPIDFIETLKADPTNAGDKVRVLNWLSEEWEKAAAEKAAAEKAAAKCWELSESERRIIQSLGHAHKHESGRDAHK